MFEKSHNVNNTYISVNTDTKKAPKVPFS